MNNNNDIFLRCDSVSFPHAFSTRLGGVSHGQFNSLNLGFNYGDDIVNVKKNWHIYSQSCGVSIDKIAYCTQVHKNEVVVVDNNNATNLDDLAPAGNYDGLVTNTRGITLIIFTADCGCLLLCDPKNRVVANLHCGWKSFTSDIIFEGIKKMKRLGASIDCIEVGIGPCICQKCFETDKNVVDGFCDVLKNDVNKAYYFNRENNKYYPDLKSGIFLRLLQLGICYDKISCVDQCTMCNVDKYFSYRGESGSTGRLAHIVTIPN